MLNGVCRQAALIHLDCIVLCAVSATLGFLYVQRARLVLQARLEPGACWSAAAAAVSASLHTKLIIGYFQPALKSDYHPEV